MSSLTTDGDGFFSAAVATAVLLKAVSSTAGAAVHRTLARRTRPARRDGDRSVPSAGAGGTGAVCGGWSGHGPAHGVGTPGSWLSGWAMK